MKRRAPHCCQGQPHRSATTRVLHFELLDSRLLLSANAGGASDAAADEWLGDAAQTLSTLGRQPSFSLSQTDSPAPAPSISKTVSVASATAAQLMAHTFFAAQDAYLDGASRVDDATLRVSASPASKVSYILFDLTGVQGRRIESATLRVRVSEAGSALVRVQQGTSTLWTERFLSPANAPAPVATLDEAFGGFSAGTWIEFDVTAGILGDGYANFILSVASSSGNVGFSSREGAEAPQLNITSSEPAASDADNDGDVDGHDFLAWQQALATIPATPGTGADGNASGVVDAGDLDVWRSSFGTSGAPIPLDSVAFFGAKPDDEVDDRAAIQAALNANSSVYLPAGEYWISSKLTIPAGRTIYGPSAGPPAVIRVRFDTGANANNYALEIVGDGVTIRDLVIDKDFIDGSYGVGIIANGRKDLTIAGVEIRDYSVRYGIHLIECDDFEIADVYIHDFMMNQSNPGGTVSDMIQDSPAGIRITRSTNGSIRDSRIHNIEVGPLARASISELVPSYGPQQYQSDCITLSDSSRIVVEDNNLWNSGELVDVLVSDNCIVRNNTMQMAYYLAVKCIGSQNCTISENYMADAAVGIILVDHAQTGEQCTGNYIDRNEIVNCGSRGIWNIAANARLGIAISGIYVDNEAIGNTITNNNIYNINNYLSQYVRQGTGVNSLANNDGIATEFGPAGGGDAALLGAWSSGLTHAKQLVALNRALVFFTFAEDDSAAISATAATYGGQAMSRIADRLVVDGSRRVYVSAWVLKQDAINMATSGTFNVTWSSTPDSAAYSSVFLENIYQKAPLYSSDTSAAVASNSLATLPRAAHPGDVVLYAAAAGETGDFTPGPTLVEGIELPMPGAAGTAGSKIATGTTEFASVTHPNLGLGAIVMACLQKNPGVIVGGQTINITALGAFPNDGVNDAVILQNALNNSAYEEIYLPPGVYHFDRSVFVPSYKSVRGDSFTNTEIRTLADITPFRIDFQVGATISDLSFTRPQTSNSNNEIVRGDDASLVVLKNLLISNAASRAPMINIIGGDRPTVSGCYVFDYQVIRSEPSAELPGNHTQVYGSGITLTDCTNIAILDCQVTQTTPIFVPNPTVKGWHQSSAIQVPVCGSGRLSGNYIAYTGQGIDTSGAAGLWIRDNVIEQCHSAGIKLVNGSNGMIVEENYLRTCGLTGIWVSVGVAGNGGSYNNIIRDNILVSIGKGVGLDFWDFNFTLSTPAAIHIQAAQLESDRVRNNVIVNNTSYDNAEQRGVVMIESSDYPGIDNVIQGNVASDGAVPAAPFGLKAWPPLFISMDHI